MTSNASSKPASTVLFTTACLAVFLSVLLNGWITLDANISFRVVHNAVQGYGLRWNIDERVHVFTHPLWMLLHIPLYAATGNMYLSTIVLSAVCATLAAVVLIRLVPAPAVWQRILLVLVPLSLSRNFNLYAICGLENPLGMLWVALFMFELFQPSTPTRCYRLWLWAALAAFTRLDLLVLFLPALLFITWRRRCQWAWGKWLVALSPWLLWESFSLLYYGFFQPNTRYAKLPTNIDILSYVRHGQHYLAKSFQFDPAGGYLVTIACEIAVLCFFLARKLQPGSLPYQVAMGLALMGAGIVADAFYVIVVGGDYMPGGRLLTSMHFAALGIIVVFVSRFGQLRRATYLACILLPFLGLHSLNIYVNPKHTGTNLFSVHNEQDRKLRYTTMDLFTKRHTPFSNRVSKPVPSTYPYRVWSVIAVGWLGSKTGGNVIIDRYALCDALLARLPTSHPKAWLAGHLFRKVPEGYIQARKTGDVSGMHPALAKYYQKLRLVTSGDLFDPERLKAILGFQLGWYDVWLDEYLKES